MASFINENFIPFTVNIHEKAGLFGRFQAAWTPTVLVMSPKGIERFRVEGYLPPEEFRPHLEMGLARVEFMAKHFERARDWYRHIMQEHAESSLAAEATYWESVCSYNLDHDPTPLSEVSQVLRERFADSIWAIKASVWAPAESPADKASLH